jgi:hypothetical protein
MSQMIANLMELRAFLTSELEQVDHLLRIYERKTGVVVLKPKPKKSETKLKLVETKPVPSPIDATTLFQANAAAPFETPPPETRRLLRRAKRRVLWQR